VGTKFSELVDDAIDFYKKNRSSWSDFEQRVGLANEDFGHRVADSITGDELQAWMDEMADEHDWTPGTRNRYRSSLSTVFREGIFANKIKNNPARMIRHCKEPDGRIRFLEEEEERRLRQAIVDPLNGRANDTETCLAQLDIALHTGMRRGEQFTVTMDQVNLKHKHIFLQKTKNGSSRYVHLNPVALEALTRLREKHQQLGLPSNALLFPSLREGDDPIKNPRKWFSTVCEQAGLTDVTWHTLRHTFASRLVMNNVNLKTVQELMGHKTIAMTMRYSHLAPHMQQEALATLVPGRVVVVPSPAGTKNHVPNGPKMAPSTKKSTSQVEVNLAEAQSVQSVS
jgi:integrase